MFPHSFIRMDLFLFDNFANLKIKIFHYYDMHGRRFNKPNLKIEKVWKSRRKLDSKRQHNYLTMDNDDHSIKHIFSKYRNA